MHLKTVGSNSRSVFNCSVSSCTISWLEVSVIIQIGFSAVAVAAVEV